MKKRDFPPGSGNGPVFSRETRLNALERVLRDLATASGNGPIDGLTLNQRGKL